MRWYGSVTFIINDFLLLGYLYKVFIHSQAKMVPMCLLSAQRGKWRSEKCTGFDPESTTVSWLWATHTEIPTFKKKNVVFSVAPARKDYLFQLYPVQLYDSMIRSGNARIEQERCFSYRTLKLLKCLVAEWLDGKTKQVCTGTIYVISYENDTFHRKI